MEKMIDMDEWVRFSLERNPQVLVYKAIFEMVEDLEFPIESREDLRKQLVKPDSKAEEQVEIIALTKEFFPAYLFPMSSKQNALEKIAETVELILYKTPVVGTYPQPRREGGLAVRQWPDPHDPGCMDVCHHLHSIAMLSIIGNPIFALPQSGWAQFAATMKEHKKLMKCLEKCSPAPPSPETF